MPARERQKPGCTHTNGTASMLVPCITLSWLIPILSLALDKFLALPLNLQNAHNQISEFWASLVYRESSEMSKDTKRSFVLKNQEKRGEQDCFPLSYIWGYQIHSEPQIHGIKQFHLFVLKVFLLGKGMFLMPKCCTVNTHNPIFLSKVLTRDFPF